MNREIAAPDAVYQPAENPHKLLIMLQLWSWIYHRSFDSKPLRRTSNGSMRCFSVMIMPIRRIDDIRAFAYRQKSRIACWADADTAESLTGRFGYIFKGVKDYPAIADVRACPHYGERFQIEGPSGAIPVLGYEMDHGQVRATGFRFGDVAYSSDVVGLPGTSKALLKNLDVFIVDALRYTPHPSHAHLDLALQWIEELKPQRAIVTNLHVDMDYQTLVRTLPPGVEPAYDGLTIRSSL